MKRESLLIISALLYALFFNSLPITGAEEEENRRLRDDFITASLLTVSPGERVYQGFGHAVIRMECPSEGLDYIFTFESNVGPNLAFEFARGIDARVIALETGEFISDMKKEGRGITSYPLNLTPAQKQELWRVLDGRLQEDATGIDIRRTNCLSTLFEAIQEAAGPERLSLLESEIADLSNGEYFEELLGEKYPWGELMFKSLYGAASDEVDAPFVRTSPVSFEREHDRFMIGDRRLTGEGRVLAAPAKKKGAETLSPLAVSFALSALLLISMILVLWGRWGHLCRLITWLALGCLALGGCLELCLTLFPWRIGSAWSSSCIVLNPIAIFLLAVFRRRRRALMWTLVAWGAVCLGYSAFGRIATSEATAAVRILGLFTGLWCAVSAFALRRRGSRAL